MELGKDTMEKKYKLNITGLVTWIVFLLTLVITLLSLIPVIFPALLLRLFGGFEDNVGINPFEIGMLAYPLLVTNLLILGLGLLYVKNRLPQQITKSIKFIFNFEISSNVAFLVMTILIGIYITLSVGELFDGIYQADYYAHFQPWLEIYSVTTFDVTPIGYHMAFFFDTISMQVFENYKVIPFIASISLLVLTYFVTVEISKKRFAGIVSMVIVLQSNVFLTYDTSPTYPTFWILFYLLSLYLITKKWFLSPISYVVGSISKAMTAPFLPMTLFFIYRANISNQKKMKSVILYGIIVILGLVLLSVMDLTLFDTGFDTRVGNFSTHDFLGSLSALYFALRYDWLVLLFLLPLIFGLFHASRRGILQADSIMFLILGILLSGPLINGFSDFIILPYRFMPFVVFFAMGAGILLSRKVIAKS